MPANTRPIYSLAANVSNNNAGAMNQAFTAAANDYTGIGGNNSLVFTAGANGSLISRLRFKPIGTNVASVMRVFINNGSAVGTAANNSFYGEVTLPATTVSAVAALVEIDYPMGYVIPAGYRVYVGLGTAVAAGWICFPVAGNY